MKVLESTVPKPAVLGDASDVAARARMLRRVRTDPADCEAQIRCAPLPDTLEINALDLFPTLTGMCLAIDETCACCVAYTPTLPTVRRRSGAQRNRHAKRHTLSLSDADAHSMCDQGWCVTAGHGLLHET